jgi:hypothetical protein
MVGDVHVIDRPIAFGCDPVDVAVMYLMKQ